MSIATDQSITVKYKSVQEFPDPDECAATGQSCSIRACGPNGELQCQFCGDEPRDSTGENK